MNEHSTEKDEPCGCLVDIPHLAGEIPECITSLSIPPVEDEQ